MPPLQVGQDFENLSRTVTGTKNFMLNPVLMCFNLHLSTYIIFFFVISQFFTRYIFWVARLLKMVFNLTVKTILKTQNWTKFECLHIFSRRALAMTNWYHNYFHGIVESSCWGFRAIWKLHRYPSPTHTDVWKCKKL